MLTLSLPGVLMISGEVEGRVAGENWRILCHWSSLLRPFPALPLALSAQDYYRAKLLGERAGQIRWYKCQGRRQGTPLCVEQKPPNDDWLIFE